MTPSPEYHINRFLCEQCKFFKRYDLAYHIVNDEGKIISKEIQSTFGKCGRSNKNLEGREHGCKKFERV